MAPRNPSNPAPVRALTRTREILPYWSRSTAGSRCAQSILFQTAILGTASAPISPSTLSTSAACSARAGEAASTTCSSRSARTVSSSVARNVAPIQLELRLPRAAGLAEAAALALEVRPAPHQPRRQVLEPGQLDLQLAFGGLRALREDLEDQLGAVHDAALQLALEVALLGRRQLVVEHHVHGIELGGRARDLSDLADAGVELRIGAAATPAHQLVARDPGAFHQAHHLLDVLSICGVAEIQAHEDGRQRIGGCGGTV